MEMYVDMIKFLGTKNISCKNFWGSRLRIWLLSNKQDVLILEVNFTKITSNLYMIFLWILRSANWGFESQVFVIVNCLSQRFAMHVFLHILDFPHEIYTDCEIGEMIIIDIIIVASKPYTPYYDSFPYHFIITIKYFHHFRTTGSF